MSRGRLVGFVAEVCWMGMVACLALDAVMDAPKVGRWGLALSAAAAAATVSAVILGSSGRDDDGERADRVEAIRKMMDR